jgi:hypothetical protein
MSLTKLVNPPNLSNSGDKNRYMSNMRQMLNDKRSADIAEQAAADNQIFRQATLDQGNARLDILGKKNDYDMQGGDRDTATAKLLNDNQVLRDATTASTNATVASTLAGVRADEVNNATKDAATLRGVLNQESLDAEAAATNLGNAQRAERTGLINEATDGQIFSNFSDSTIEGVQADPRFQALYATQHPSDKTGVPQQQAFMNQMLSDIQANPASYEDPNVIIRNINELADSEGWDDATRKSAMDEALRDFTKLDSATAESQQKVISENQKQLVDVITGTSADGSTGSKSQQALIKKMYESGEAGKQQDYLKEWIGLHGNKQGESSLLTKTVELGPNFINEKNVSGANIQPLFAHFAKQGLTIPAVIQSLEGLRLVEGGSYKTLEPREMLAKPDVLEQIANLAQDFQQTGGSGSGRSLDNSIALVRAAQGDATAQRNNVKGNQLFRQNTDGNRLSYILSQLPGKSGAKTRAEAVRNAEKVVDSKILSSAGVEVKPTVAINATNDMPVFSSNGGRPKPSIGGLARQKLEEAAELERLSNLSPTRRTRSR